MSGTLVAVSFGGGRLGIDLARGAVSRQEDVGTPSLATFFGVFLLVLTLAGSAVFLHFFAGGGVGVSLSDRLTDDSTPLSSCRRSLREKCLAFSTCSISGSGSEP